MACAVENERKSLSTSGAEDEKRLLALNENVGGYISVKCCCHVDAVLPPLL